MDIDLDEKNPEVSLHRIDEPPADLCDFTLDFVKNRKSLDNLRFLTAKLLEIFAPIRKSDLCFMYDALLMQHNWLCMGEDVHRKTAEIRSKRKEKADSLQKSSVF